MNEEQKPLPDDTGMQDLSEIFAPSWARQSPEEVTRRADRYARDDADAGEGPRSRSSERGILRSPRPARSPRSGAAGGRDSDDRRPPRRESGLGGPRGGGRGERSGDFRPPQAFVPRPEPPRPLPLDVRFLPEQKALGAVIRRIQATRRAYPIRDIVRLFQKSDEGILVRIEGQKGSGEPPALFQCRVCGMPAMSDTEVREHLLRRHLEDFYEVEEVESEAPGGHFSCVARCGLSGELLGPPNHHSFGLRVQEMLRERYPDLTEEEFRGRIEMVRDPEVVEAWRAANRRQKRYRRKPEPVAPSPAAPAADQGGAAPEAEAPIPAEAPVAPAAPAESAPSAPGVERHVAELQFNREIVPQQIGSATHLVCPATALKNMTNRRLAAFLNERFDEETRRNGSLFHAIHGAFRHRSLHLFRAVDERGPEFVMAVKPIPMETTHVVASLRQILAFVGDHPSCTQQALIEALEPSGEAAARAELATQVQWLVEKGNLVAFFNGMLALPAEHPVFRPHGPSARPKGTGDRKGSAREAAATVPGEAAVAAEPGQTPAAGSAGATADAPAADTSAAAGGSLPAAEAAEPAPVAPGDAGTTPTTETAADAASTTTQTETP